MINKKDKAILFLGKSNDVNCIEALKYCEERFEGVSVHLGDWGETIPRSALKWKGQYIISYLSRWVVPESLLKKASSLAINFHPASPDYPGIGCNNFALYDEASEYGVTCHHMTPTVDNGKIIAVKRFPVYPEDNVETLLSRTYKFQLQLFKEVVDKIYDGVSVPESNEVWGRRPYTRTEFNALFQLNCSMSKDEVSRRIRATSYLEWQPSLEIHGFRLVYDGRSDARTSSLQK